MTNQEIRKLSDEEIIAKLNKRINDNKEELLKLRMKQATGTLENPARIHELRKDVARYKTILSNRTEEN